MKVVLTGLALMLVCACTEAVLAKDLNHEQEDRACSLDDGERTITIASAPQGTIPQLWTSFDTCSCSSRRFGSSIAIPEAEILTLRHRISATCCGCFSIKTATTIVAECRASHPSKNDTGFNAMPIPFLRLRAVESGSIVPRDCARSSSLFPAAGSKMTGLPGIAWKTCRDGFPVAPVGGEVAMSPE